MMSGQMNWGRLGDVCFKLYVLCLLCLGFWSTYKVAGFFPDLMKLLPPWLGWGFIALVICSLFLVYVPLMVGLFFRRRWARVLWTVSLFFTLFKTLVHLWCYGPFSPKNSWSSVSGHVVGIGLLLGLCFCRPFRRYINRDGGRAWLPVGVVVLLTGALVVGAFVVHFDRILRDNPVEVLELPENRFDEPLPAGWREEMIGEFVLSVPVGAADKMFARDAGRELHVFDAKEGDMKDRTTILDDTDPVYTCLPAMYGINSLERDFVSRYTSWTYLAAIHRMTMPAGLTHAGFRSADTFDLMFELRGDSLGQWIEVHLETKPDQNHYSCFLRSKERLSLDEKLRMIARVRMADSE